MDSDAEDIDETIHLERGQNLFEIHIKQVKIGNLYLTVLMALHTCMQLSLSANGVKVVGDEDAMMFCTWEFYDFEIHSTPVLKGPKY